MEGFEISMTTTRPLITVVLVYRIALLQAGVGLQRPLLGLLAEVEGFARLRRPW